MIQFNLAKHWVEISKVCDDESSTCLNRHFRCKHSKQTAAKNTWFERHHIPMEDVLLIAYAFTRKWKYDDVIHEISEHGRATLSRETVADLFHFCREVIMDS